MKVKGTLNVHIPSPNELFERDRVMLRSLYPQNYTEPKKQSRASNKEHMSSVHTEASQNSQTKTSQQ